jgi:hypothetical protein
MLNIKTIISIFNKEGNKMELLGFNRNSLGHLEAKGLSKVFEAYSENCKNYQYIDNIGFNSHTGHIYIELENGVIITSLVGGDVEYTVTDYSTMEDFKFDTYTEAVGKINQISK